MVKPGDIVFFREAKRSSQNAIGFRFKGHGYALLLGEVPMLQADPPESHILRVIGSIGFFCFDDLKNFFDEKTQNEFLEKFKAKYYPPASAIVKDRTKLLLDQNGKPMEIH